ncbi:hypothetical protein, partial [Runella sp.]|uniref:hypothetical protein n=1 Tax=Runella sp. TaxID=1960881 RepID=UPI0030161D8E
MIFFTVSKIEKRKLKIWFPNSKVTFLTRKASRAKYRFPIHPARWGCVLSLEYLINSVTNQGLRSFPNLLQYEYEGVRKSADLFQAAILTFF